MIDSTIRDSRTVTGVLGTVSRERVAQDQPRKGQRVIKPVVTVFESVDPLGLGAKSGARATEQVRLLLKTT